LTRNFVLLWIPIVARPDQELMAYLSFCLSNRFPMFLTDDISFPVFLSGTETGNGKN